MGICRANRFKRRLTGGRMAIHKKKKKYEMGRPPTNTKLGTSRIRPLRVRGGNKKYRAVRLDHGCFAWSSESCTRKTRIVAVVYNATSNELVRTNTITKNSIVQIDSTPFRQWYQQNYGVELQKKKRKTAEEEAAEAVAAPATTTASDKAKKRRLFPLDLAIEEQIGSGRVLACISSRPGQCGHANGYILEGKELEFYKRKLEKKKKK